MHGHKAFRFALWSLLSYIVISVIYFGWPVLTHPHTYFVGHEADTSLFIWMLNWWPFALSHHLNPFYSHYIWYPMGYSIANATAIPLYALLFWPITTHFGAQISYNLLAISLSALNAWAMYGFAWFLTKRFSAAWVSGFVFGFSTYIIAQTMVGHLNLISIYPLPLLAWALCAFCQGKSNAWQALIALAGIFILSFGSSREVFAIMWVIGTCAAVIALYYFQAYRRKIFISYGLCIIASLIVLCVYWPYLWAFVHYLPTTKTGTLWSAEGYFWNVLIPTNLSIANAFLPHGFVQTLTSESLAALTNYIGFFIIILLLFWFGRTYKSPARAMLIWCWLLSMLASLGPFILLKNSDFSDVFSPMILMIHLPFLDKIGAPRFTLCAWFFLSLIVALWIQKTRTKPIYKMLIVVLCILSILPSFSHQKRMWYTKTIPLTFFQHHDYDAYCTPNPHPWIFTATPWLGQSVRWQVASHMAFKQYYGYVNYFPRIGYPYYDLAKHTIQRTFSLLDEQRIQDFIVSQHISCLITNPATINTWPSLFSALSKPIYTGDGVVVFHFSDGDK